ncbi:hypothetical protein JQ600_19695 [Bradyrhizobium sp. AUGA SZCCT0176]|uniref:hypothetical protein n=1 Tax=Bradyrhizobium sp. AUGA SZCCT0176 TaxID=2807664 RepID=UPI001BAAF84B|nr:hypothetical protein [Bradyrhizobium sp. AUGA SZCCT0176]MBR1227158.1 hypothetical protein [Bradyrhizobium sp. AUGA SZCCT0176]
MGRLAFTKKTEPVDWFEIESRGRVFFSPKSEPAFDWSEIESRLQEISTPAGPPDVLVERWVSSSNDQAEITDRPVTNPSHPLGFLFSPSEGVASPSSHQNIITEIAGRNRGLIHRLG